MTEPVVGFVDYRAGNLLSLENAFVHLGVRVKRVSSPEAFEGTTHIVLPGVGAFGHCRRNLSESGLVDRLTEWALTENRPTLGICVGMQLMAERGLEHEPVEGLGWFPGEIAPLPADPPAFRVPHVGWTEIAFDGSLPGIEAGARMDVYFNHSYALLHTTPEHVVAYCDHGARFTAIVKRDNILATQFHPEKSQRAGERVLRAFLELRG